MDKIQKLISIIPLYNSMQEYQNYYVRNICSKKELEGTFDINSIRLAALSMIILNIMMLKEDIIENEGELIYTSKINEEKLKYCFHFIADPVGNNKFKLGNVIDTAPTLYAMIRNKISHGDFYITPNSIILNKIEGEIEININLFIHFFNELNEQLFLTTKCNVYKRSLLYNKHKNKNMITKPLETKEEVENFLKLFFYSTYKITSIDNKEIPTDIKLLLEREIKLASDKISNINDNKKLLGELTKKLYKMGYILNIENKKIKDKEIIDKITNLLINMEFKENEKNPNELVWLYGENIGKVLNSERNGKKGIILASRVNIAILSQLILFGKETDLDYIIERRLFNTDVPKISYLFQKEIMASMILAKFVNSYTYCLDDVFKKDNNYHLDRTGLLDFSKLNLKELKPSIINIDTKGKEESYRKLETSIKNREYLDEKKKKIEGYIEGLSKKKKLSEKEQKKLDEFKNIIIDIDNSYVKADLDIIEKTTYYNDVIKDYEENYDYFKNMAIIEGIRNSLAHGNIELIDNYEGKKLYDIKIKFTNIYKGEKVFEMTSSLYELESLFIKSNIDVINDFEKEHKVLKRK